MANEDPVQKKLSQIGEEFSFEILRSEVERHPGNVDALSEYAGLLTRQGRYREGLEVDLHLANLRPSDPIVHYNLCCSYALLGDPEKAVAELRKAVNLGYSDFDFLRRDSDLKSLHSHPGFQQILSGLKKNPSV